MDITIDSDSPLPSTVEAITADCLQFRILVAGKMGCGKSSLINKVFGVEKDFAHVSHDGPGKAKIDFEFRHSSNDRFILHDSEGFEPGDQDKFNVVKRFIEERNDMPLKDKLHAIWICISVPVAGDRILESGVEQLFKINRGAVPLIFVFTKYDMLVSSAIFRGLANDQELSEEQVRSNGERSANEAFDELCIGPLIKAFGEVPVTKVSCQLRYKDTIKELIAATDEEIKRQIGVSSHTEPRSLSFAAAQRMNTDVKVEATVDIGKLKYWSGLLSITDFTGKKLRQCLDVIHRDIVFVWNIRNSNYLADDDFKAKMIVLVDDLVTNPNTPTHSGGLTVATVAAIASAASSPAGIAILSVGTVILLAEWIFDVYQNTSHNISCIMAYIVDLMIVMHRLSAIEISQEHVISTLQDYARSREIAEVHNDIRKFCGRFPSSTFGDTDNTLNEITRLIEKHCVQV